MPSAELVQAKAEYEAARNLAGLPPLPQDRLWEIARARVAFRKWMADKGQPRRRFGFRLAPPPAPPVNHVDFAEARLWSRGCTAFWLDPDRWYGVPYGPNGHLEPFWMHLRKRPTPSQDEGGDGGAG